MVVYEGPQKLLFPVYIIAFTVTGISFVTRALLIIRTFHVVTWNISTVSVTLGIGSFYDLVIASYFIIPVVLHLWLMTNTVYSRTGKILVPLAFAVIMSLLLFTQIVPKDFNSDLTKFVIWYLVIRLVLYILLASESLFFTNLYATGTRTVRGLEALSLSIPPTPGQSIIKRPANENLFTLGSVFNSKGYAGIRYRLSAVSYQL